MTILAVAGLAKRFAGNAVLRGIDLSVEKGERIVIVFEGRDAAGKGGAIQRLTQHLNPRQARIVALSKPTPTEAGQW